MDNLYGIDDDDDVIILTNTSFRDEDDTYYLETNNDTSPKCPEDEVGEYDSFFGVTLAVPEWEAVLTAITLTAIIILTIIGNILVILSVFTHRPLRIVQNFFIVSLAVADLTVAILVLPFNVAYSILGRWVFGKHVCKMWLTCDVLCCTASILNLGAIALDRYWAITDPINYAQKRTVKRVLMMIGGVWLLSGLISSPPLLGWNDWPDEFEADTPCRLTQQQGYVVYSSLGSFFIPLVIMTIVYVEIFIATRRRLRERAKASKLNAVKQTVIPSMQQTTVQKTDHQDNDSVSSENLQNDHQESHKPDKKKKGKRKKKKERKQEACKTLLVERHMPEDSVTENQELSSGSQKANSQEENHTTTFTNASNSESSKTLIHKDKVQNEQAPTVNLLPAKRTNTVSQFIEEKQKISLSKERRAARTLGIIMGVFVVCWLPFFLMYVIDPFCPTCCPSGKFINFITWLGYINSALNPIIYTIFNLDFRKAFKKLLRMKV